MKRTVFFWQAIGFLFTSLAGVLLHFLYEWTGESVFTAPFSAVNESTWEHMKLLYWPLLLYALYERRYFKERKNYWCIKLIGTLLGLVSIPVLFYTLNGVLGKTPDWLNITIFFIAAAITFIFESYLLKQEDKKCKWERVSFVLLCFIGVLFIIFTFFTPKIPLFQDPINKSYGI